MIEEAGRIVLIEVKAEERTVFTQEELVIFTNIRYTNERDIGIAFFDKKGIA